MSEVLWLTLEEIRQADAAHDAAAGPGHAASASPPGTRSANGVAVAGQDGYLFIADGVNRWEAQFLGEMQIAPSWFESWTELLAARRERAAAAGVGLWNIVIPEKQVIYPDLRWPGQPAVGAMRPLRQLQPRLAGREPLLYPEAELIAARGAGPAYFRHNSHWTPFGCCAASALLLAAMEARIGDRPLRFAYRPEHGKQDLTVHMFDASILEDQGALAPAGEVYFDNQQFARTGRHTRSSYGVRNPRAPDPRTVIIFGDSFAYDAGLTCALSTAFARVIFVWSKGVLWDEVAAHAAQLVVWESAERFLATVPTA
jgi:alginate O-acetyltransferase complex protein AlgJ